MFGVFRAWRRRRILRTHTIDEALWRRVSSRFAFVDRLDGQERSRLRELCLLFLHEKQISAAGDAVLNDEIRLGIAIQACILILNLGMDSYRDWVEIIVYPDEFMPRQEYRNEHGLVETDGHVYAGQAWLRGPVILAAPRIEMAWMSDGANVVIHEFAHKLDMLTGDANGFPPLHKGMDRRMWSQVFNEAYADFCQRISVDEPTDLDPYASQSPAEFFAVLSESFFELPMMLWQSYPQVYEQFVLFFRQDPLAGNRT
jgi:Mlc titration factor MtfA (ptsG expression regulator)